MLIHSTSERILAGVNPCVWQLAQLARFRYRHGLERHTWLDLVDAAVEQLQLAGAAVIYLVQAVDTHEHRERRDRDGPIVELLAHDVDPDLSQWD